MGKEVEAAETGYKEAGQKVGAEEEEEEEEDEE